MLMLEAAISRSPMLLVTRPSTVLDRAGPAARDWLPVLGAIPDRPAQAVGDSGIGAPDDADGTDQLDVLGIVLDEAVSHRVQQPGVV